MASWLTPARRRGVEVLDDPATADDVRERAMRDVAKSNALFGGTRSVERAVDGLLPSIPEPSLLLDVGTGTGDIPARLAARHPGVVTVGLDVSVALLRKARTRLDGVVAGSVLELPLRDGSVDVVVCSQLLHHFEHADAVRVVREAQRVSRGWIVIADIRRSRLAAAAFWMASAALRFHPVTRHDGVVSVMRGFTAADLREIVRQATGVDPRIERSMFWRLAAVWRKSPTAGHAVYT